MNKCSALTVEVSFWHWERRSAATSAFEQTQIANQCEAALSTVQYPLNDNRSIRNSACSAIPSLTSKSSKLWKTAYCGLEVLTPHCSCIHIIDDTHERRSVNNQLFLANVHHTSCKEPKQLATYVELFVVCYSFLRCATTGKVSDTGIIL